MIPSVRSIGIHETDNHCGAVFIYAFEKPDPPLFGEWYMVDR